MSIDLKKRRVDNEKKKTVNHSKIYQPFRAIGYVTNEIPYVINNHGQEYFLTSCVGNSFQTYNVSSFTIGTFNRENQSLTLEFYT